MVRQSVLLLMTVALTFVPHSVSTIDVSGHSQAAQSSTPRQPPRVISRISITLPQADSELTVDGNPVSVTGATRTFETPPLEPGTTHRYTFSASWRPNTYTTMTRTRTVSFRAGDSVTLDLSVDDPTDRVRVIYVPTPQEVADAMVKLAGVTSRDVAFEPGCGDARITIAAVKGGAARGVGIDIDPDRVEESRANVRAAGLENKVEIRLGDALDIRDLSSATVVFLYMGDHFNMLIRPNLWKQLKVGSRIVSHRFTMGDWKPDKTVSMTVDDFDYELHLWTVTEEIKRKMELLEDYRSPALLATDTTR
jgi:uncharacterized protein (TIGR03000 family)